MSNDFVDFNSEKSGLEIDLNDYYNKQKQSRPLKTFVSNPMPAKPELILSDPMPDSGDLKTLTKVLEEIEAELEVAKTNLKNKEIEKAKLNNEKQIYHLKFSEYQKHLNEIDAQDNYVFECETKVADILNEIKSIVKSAKLPEEFSIDLTEKNDILFRVDENSEYLRSYRDWET